MRKLTFPCRLTCLQKSSSISSGPVPAPASPSPCHLPRALNLPGAGLAVAPEARSALPVILQLPSEGAPQKPGRDPSHNQASALELLLLPLFHPVRAPTHGAPRCPGPYSLWQGRWQSRPSLEVHLKAQSLESQEDLAPTFKTIECQVILSHRRWGPEKVTPHFPSQTSGWLSFLI